MMIVPLRAIVSPSIGWTHRCQREAIMAFASVLATNSPASSRRCGGIIRWQIAFWRALVELPLAEKPLYGWTNTVAKTHFRT